MSSKTSESKINSKGFFCKENMPLITLIILGILAVVFVVISAFVLHVPVVAACLMVILEALLAACLNKIPLWVHGLVFIAQVVAGIIAAAVAFMVMMDFIYVAAIAFLFVWAEHE